MQVQCGTTKGDEGMVKFKVEDANFNKIYPVGSIYMSINETNPSELFDGEWEQIEDKFLLACGTKHSNGSTGGSEDAIIVNHTHSVGNGLTLLKATTGQVARNQVGSSGTNRGYTWTTNSTTSANAMASGGLENTGTDGTGKNMPPYLAVYCWVRIA